MFELNKLLYWHHALHGHKVKVNKHTDVEEIKATAWELLRKSSLQNV